MHVEMHVKLYTVSYKAQHICTGSRLTCLYFDCGSSIFSSCLSPSLSPSPSPPSSLCLFDLPLSFPCCPGLDSRARCPRLPRTMKTNWSGESLSLLPRSACSDVLFALWAYPARQKRTSHKPEPPRELCSQFRYTKNTPTYGGTQG